MDLSLVSQSAAQLLLLQPRHASPVASTSKATFIKEEHYEDVEEDEYPVTSSFEKAIYTILPDMIGSVDGGNSIRSKVETIDDSMALAEHEHEWTSENACKSEDLIETDVKLADNTANMDEEKVKKIPVVSNSAYMRNQARKDDILFKRVEALQEKLEKECRSRNYDLTKEEARVDEMLAQLEKDRDLNEIVIVVDADAFYASCEERRNPELMGKAFAVGAGILTTSSYEARKFGVRSAMAGFMAKKLCPHLIMIPPDFKLYVTCSKEIMAVLEEYGEISPASLDEAYLSVTDYCRKEGVTGDEAARRIREHVKTATGLTVSAGISPNAMLSKVAADINKPDGQCLVSFTREGCMNFVRDLKIGQIPGIGRVTERYLTAFGVEKVGDIYPLRGKLYLIRKEIGLGFLLTTYLGLGRSKITPRQRNERNAVSVEETFTPTNDREFLSGQLAKIAKTVSDDLTSLKFSGKTISLTLKRSNFECISRSKTIGKDIYFQDFPSIAGHAKTMFEKEVASFRDSQINKMVPEKDWDIHLRLIGLQVSNLRDESLTGDKERLTSWRKTSAFSTLYEESEVKASIEAADGNEIIENLDEAEETGEAMYERHKAFWTAGESMNSKKRLPDLIPIEDRLSFPSAIDGQPRQGELVCPVCQVAFMSSQLALSAHVETHFASANMPVLRKGKPPKKRTRLQERLKEIAKESGDTEDDDIVIVDYKPDQKTAKGLQGYFTKT